MKHALKVRVDVNIGLTETTIAVLRAFFPNANITVTEKLEKVNEPKVEKPAEQKAEKPAEQKAEKPAEQKAEKPAEQKAEKPAEQKAEKLTDTKVTLTVEQVRTLLGTKITKNRDEVKAKLTALKANNISTLKPENYQEFYDFLLSLPE